jgi:hypothetical protein
MRLSLSPPLWYVVYWVLTGVAWIGLLLAGLRFWIAPWIVSALKGSR